MQYHGYKVYSVHENTSVYQLKSFKCLCPVQDEFSLCANPTLFQPYMLQGILPNTLEDIPCCYAL